MKSIILILTICGFCQLILAQDNHRQDGLRKYDEEFYSDALTGSWLLRIDLLSHFDEDQKRGAYEKMANVAFVYWVYSTNKIIPIDLKFERILRYSYKTGNENPGLPLEYLDDPIKMKSVKSIPGFKWSLEEYLRLVEGFKKFVAE